MGKKFLILLVLVLTSVVILPAESRAESNNGNSASTVLKVEPLFQKGRGNRGMNRNYRAWRRGNNRYNNTNSRRRARFLRQTYYRNGRRYTRIIRVY
jgi:hypothetical protein